MSDLQEFSMEIPAFTPETMPFNRLLAYLEQAAILLGEPSDLHLVDIREGSTCPVFALRKDVAKRAIERVSEVRRGGGSTRRRAAYRKINHMVSEDGGPAFLRVENEEPILTFQGEPDSVNAVKGVRQATKVDGILARIGGTGKYSQLLIQDWDGETIAGCSTTRTLAKELAAYLYEPIRLNGIGTWERSEEGVWTLDHMQVQSYSPLDDKGHMEIVRELQAVNVSWPHDTIEKLTAYQSGEE